jgi:hypothetical protein
LFRRRRAEFYDQFLLIEAGRDKGSGHQQRQPQLLEQWPNASQGRTPPMVALGDEEPAKRRPIALV